MIRPTTIQRVAAIASLHSITIEEVESRVARLRAMGMSRSAAISSVSGSLEERAEHGDFYADRERIDEIAVRHGVEKSDVRQAVHDLQVHLGVTREEALDAVDASATQSRTAAFVASA